METTKTQTTTPLHFDDSDVYNWALPEGAIARLGRGSVRDMAFSPDGKYFAVGSPIGLWIYQYHTCSPIVLWETDKGFIDCVTFSPDSQWIASYTYLQAIRIWDIQNGVCISEMELPKEKNRLSSIKPIFSQDWEHLVAFNYPTRKIYIWCSRTGTLKNEIEVVISDTEAGSINAIYPSCFSPDLRFLAGTCYDHKNRTAEYIVVWNVDTGEQITRLDWTERWGRNCFSQCGRYFATGGSEGIINVWDVENGNLENAYTGYEDANMVPYFSSEDNLIAAMVFPSPPKIEIWDLGKNEKIDTLKRGSRGSFVRFSKSGSQLAYTDDGEIKFWTRKEPVSQLLPSIKGHTRTVSSLVLRKEEKTLVATYWGWKALFWDISRKCARRPNGEDLPTSRTLHTYLSSDGKIFATGGDEDFLKVWENGNSESVAELPLHEIKLNPITGTESFALTSDRLARADRDHNIYIWKCKSALDKKGTKEGWKLHVNLTGHTEYIEGVAFSPYGKQLASISRDQTARLWDVEAGKQITELPLAPPSGRRGYRSYDRGITYSPRGDLIAAGQWGEIVLWNASDGNIFTIIPQPEGNQRPITLCFTPCGEYLFSGSWWQGGLQKVPIHLWKVATGENIATFSGHTTDVQCLAISQDCTVFASGGHDGAIFLWDLKPYL